jgi:hypothetical protein
VFQDRNFEVLSETNIDVDAQTAAVARALAG